MNEYFMKQFIRIWKDEVIVERNLQIPLLIDKRIRVYKNNNIP